MVDVWNDPNIWGKPGQPSKWRQFVDTLKTHDWGNTADVVSQRVGEGVADMVGIGEQVGDLITGQPIARQAARQMGVKLPEPDYVNQARGAYEQQVPQETSKGRIDKYAGAIAEGVGAGGPFLPEAEGPKAVASLLLGGAGSGIGSQAGEDLFPDNPYASTIGMLVGGLIGGVAPNTGDIASAARGRYRVWDGSRNPNFNRMIDITANSESHFNPNAVSRKGAKGVMQVMDATARDPGHGIKPSDGTPEDTARVGRQLFAALLSKYDHNPEKAWAAYNWGEGNLDKAIKAHGDLWLDHAPEETRSYVEKNVAELNGGPDVGGRGVPPISPQAMSIAMGDPGAAGAEMPNVGESFAHQDMALTENGPKESEPVPLKNVEDLAQGAKENEPGTEQERPVAPTEEPQAQSEMPAEIPHEDMFPQAEEPHQLELPNLGEQVQDMEMQQAEMSPPKPANNNSIHPEDDPYDELDRKLDAGEITGDEYDRQARELDKQIVTPEERARMNNFASELTPAEQQEMDASAPKPEVEPSVSTKAGPDAGRYRANDNLPGEGPEMSGDIRPGGYQGEEGQGPPIPPAPPTDELPPPPGGEPPLPKYAGSINLNRMAITDAAKRQLVSMVRPEDANPMSFAKIMEGAKKLLDKYGFNGVLNLKRISPDDFEKYQHAVRVIHSSLQEKAFELGKLMEDPTKRTPAIEAAFRDTVEHLGLAYERNSKNAQVLGRGLSSRRINVGPTKEINDLAQNLKDGMTMDEIWNKMKMAPDKAGKIARDAMAHGALDYFRAYYYNVDLLSRPTTIEHVLGGNALITVARDAEHVVAAILGLPLKALGINDRVSVHEVMGRLIGHAVGLKKAFSRWVDEDGVQHEAPFVEAWKRHAPLDWGDRTGQSYNVLKGKAWLPMTAIARTVSAVDELSRNFSYYAEIYGGAVRQAIKEGISPEKNLIYKNPEFTARVNQLINEPTPEMMKNVKELAKQVRLQDTPSPIGRKLQEWSHSNHATVSLPATFLFPFVRMMDASTRLAIRYMPGATFLDRYTRSDIKSGIAGSSVVAGRMAIGATMMYMVAKYTGSGQLTGIGPSDPAARKQWLVNHQEESVKVGNKWYSYSWTPFAPLMSGVATGVERLKESKDSKDSSDYVKTAEGAALGFGHGLTKSSWAGALSDVFDLFEDSNQGPGKLNSFIGKEAASVAVPGMVQRIDQITDPVHRDLSANDATHQVTNQIQGVVPGQSEKFPQQYDVYGNPIRREGGASQMINPSSMKTISSDPVTKEMDDLGEKVVTGAPRNVNGVRLTAQQHSDYQQLSGQLFRANMSDIIGSPDWAFMDNDAKKALVKKTLAAARKDAREQLDIGKKPSDDPWNF